MMKQSRTLKILALLFAAGLMLSFTVIAVAQSGRRANKPTQPTPPPAVTATAPAIAKPSPEKLGPRVTLLVGMDRSDPFSRIPLNASSGVLHSCVDRLNDSASVKVVMESQDLPRSDAVKKAKASKDGQHVVWLQVHLDRGASQGANINLSDVVIEYMVFAPTTAKLVASGRTYPETYRNKSINPTKRTGGMYGDFLYNEAAREAAERILRAFHVPTRPVPST
ncbi:MAG TPA: hypothetical protein VEW46_19605 [Pyrinomonadaceae bacterium]|nr:hypothetical protein [Pyrinomonadaceae bacterium]